MYNLFKNAKLDIKDIYNIRGEDIIEIKNNLKELQKKFNKEEKNYNHNISKFQNITTKLKNLSNSNINIMNSNRTKTTKKHYKEYYHKLISPLTIPPSYVVEQIEKIRLDYQEFKLPLLIYIYSEDSKGNKIPLSYFIVEIFLDSVELYLDTYYPIQNGILAYSFLYLILFCKKLNIDKLTWLPTAKTIAIYRGKLHAHINNTDGKFFLDVNDLYEKVKNKSLLTSLLSVKNNKKDTFNILDNLANKTLEKFMTLLVQKGSSQFIKIKNYGRRKIRYQKNGKPYVIVKGKKLKL